MKCSICNREPKDILEYKMASDENGISPEEYIKQEEGTYNPLHKIFYCTNCYISIGMPLGQAQPIDSEISEL